MAITWTDERAAQLFDLAGDKSMNITQERLDEITEALEGPTKRSVGAKLRKEGYSVDKATAKPSAWSEAETAELTSFVQANSGTLTYAEIAASFLDGKFTTKQVQGKLLSLELTGDVKPTPKAETSKSYTDAEEAEFIRLAEAGSVIEDIAEALGRTVPQVRGKALSLLQQERIAEMPATGNKSEKVATDVLAGLDVENMTVEQLVESTGKTDRGIKSMLSRRGVNCADYKGADKKAKNDAKRDAE